jgi:phosphatidylinositol-4,5-bisphosphate 3-kinase
MMSERCQGPNFVEAWEPREEGVLAKLDPLLALTARESQRLQKVELLRETAPTAAKLPLYLLATGWERPEQVANAHRMLDGSWAQPETLLDVLPLLDSRLHDGCVRQYASACIERINPTPEDVCRCLPQLVQALKSEHTPAASPLSELLLRRALDAPTTLGLQFFWLLQVEGAAEEEGLRQKERWRRRTGRPAGSQQKRIARDSGIAAPLARAHMPFSALQDEFVRCLGEGELRTIFQRQRKLWSREGFFAGVVHAYQADSSMPSAEEKAIVKALPAVPDRLACFIFKVGDDLRQDCLVMQLLNIMDQLWLTQGLDLPLTPYACVSTWNDGGLLQVVPNSKTLADIQKDPLFGGRLTGAWRTSPLSNFLRFNNPTASEFQDAALLFRRSLAGYCVATYLMGIGDRHNDNIMITKGGRLFHIDFGHILGCTKTFKLGKANIKREKTSFVFTREMAACLRQVDGETKDLHEFKKLIANAFNVLRLNSNQVRCCCYCERALPCTRLRLKLPYPFPSSSLSPPPHPPPRTPAQLIGLFRAMVPANLPELNSVLDVEYFRRMLQLELSIDEATSYMNKQVDGCLSTSNDFAKSADNWFHIVKQGKAGDERERLKARSQVELARGLTRHPALTQQVVLPFGVSVGRLVPQKCFVLTSAAKPLWLSFEAPEAYDFFDSLDQGRYESFLESGIPPMPDWMVSGGGRIRAASASFDETFASFHAAAGATSEAQKSAKLAIVDDHESAKLAIVDDHEEHNRDYALHHDKIWDAVLDPSSGHYYYVNIADPSNVVWTLPEGTMDEHINYDHGYDEPEAPDEAGYRL